MNLTLALLCVGALLACTFVFMDTTELAIEVNDRPTVWIMVGLWLVSFFFFIILLGEALLPVKASVQ